MSINPDCPQGGPYEASEGTYPGHGKQKLGVGKRVFLIDFFNGCVNINLNIEGVLIDSILSGH